MYLKEHRFFVLVVNLYGVKKYRNQGLKRIKTDKQDAITICKYGIDYCYWLKIIKLSVQFILLGRQFRNYMKMHIESIQNLTHLLDCVMFGIKPLLGGWNESSEKIN